MGRGVRVLAASAVVTAVVVGMVSGAPPGPRAPEAQAASTTVTLGSVEAEATFTNPTAGPNPGNVVPDRSILDQLVRLIHNTPDYGSIWMAIYHLSDSQVMRELEAAADRHVNVHLVHDHTDGGANAVDLANHPGVDNTWCDHGGTYDTTKNAWTHGTGCLSSWAGDWTQPQPDGGIMHAKFAVFSQTTDPSGVAKPWVTWFGSANETASSGTNTYNNTVTVYGDETLAKGFADPADAGSSSPHSLWYQMHQEKFWPGNDFYAAGQGIGYFSSSASKITVYASPEQDTDLVANRLSYIDPDSTCQVRFMENDIHHNSGVRDDLFAQLQRLDAGGCSMYAVAANVDHDARCALYHDHITTHQDETGNPPAAAGLPNQVSVHDKTIIVYAKYAGSTANRYIVFTGSHNLTKSALRYNDETFVKIDDSQPLYKAFYDHFGAAYSTTAKYPVPSDC
jgi:hypothetical protein